MKRDRSRKFLNKWKPTRKPPFTTHTHPMSIKCRFTDRKTNQSITLQDLDKELCAEFNITPDEENMCIYYDSICLFGIGALMRGGTCELTEEMFNNHLKLMDPPFNPDYEAKFRKYLLEKYRFEAWH